MVKKPFAKELIPGGIEIVEKRLYNLIDNIKQTDVDEKQIAPFLDDIFQKFEGLSREELIQKFVSVEFTRFLKYYKGAKDINLTVTDRKDRKSDRRSGNAQFTRFFINLGSKAGVNAAIMIGIINDNTHTRNMEIGKIDIMKRFSFFEVEKHNQKDIIQSFKNAKFRDQKIIVEVSESKPSSDEDSYGKRRSRGKRRPDSQTSSRRKNRSFDKRNKGKRR